MTQSASPHRKASIRMPTLSFFLGERPLFVHTLREGRTRIGRSDRCDVALPSSAVSRMHCVVEQRNGRWRLVDRSRHGVRVNGQPVREAWLEEGDRIGLGPYEALFGASCATWGRCATSTAAPLPAALHEELVEVEPDALTTCRAVLRGVGGQQDGRRIELDRMRMSLGGPGSTVELPGALPCAAVWLRVARGRVVVEPAGPEVRLAGLPVRTYTPALPGEELQVGPHRFLVEQETRTEPSRSLDSFGELVGRSPVMQRLFGVLHRVARHDAPVLVVGESGTGKELVARGLHSAGPRHAGPFVAVNCAAIAATLFESALFGHERGAFTGASQRQDGAFQQAAGGTLFLDEVGELGLELQAKLLRALESGEVRRVGSQRPEYPDVRVVAATNRDLAQMVRDKRFREDLYYRLSVLPVRTPPLRERREDIPLLAHTLLARHHPGARLTDEAADALQRYDWPGNVRELRNVLTRAVVLHGPIVHPGALSFHPWAFEGGSPPRTARPEDERQAILDALERTAGNRTAAARLLGMPRSSLLYKLKKYDIPKDAGR